MLQRGVRLLVVTDRRLATHGIAAGPRKTALQRSSLVMGGRAPLQAGRWLSRVARGLLLSSVGLTDCAAHGQSAPSASVGFWSPLSPGAPPREAPNITPPVVGVWSGSHVLVWGATEYCPDGANASGSCATGASYDPTSDQWQTMTLTGAPAARDLESGTWIGTGLLVWGGEGCGSLLGACSDGGIYDPSKDTWLPITATAPIPPRGQHTAVWTGRAVIIFGGVALPRQSGVTATLGGGAAYDPAAQQWSMLPSSGAPSSRYWHSVVWTGQQMIVWGGSHDGTNPLGDGAAYDPVANAWTALPAENAPHARYSHSSVWTGLEMIVWAGIGCTYGDNGALPCSDGAAYNPRTGRWRALATAGAPGPSNGAQAVWAGGNMLVWGGDGSPGGGVYDPMTDTWTAMATTGQPAPRSNQVALWTGTELVVWGGLVAENAAIDGGRFALIH